MTRTFDRPAVESLVFNGKNLLDYNVRISGGGTWNTATRDVSNIQVAGRNGDLILDNGRFNSVSIEYPAFINSKTFKKDIIALWGFLNSDAGYHRLEDTYHPDEYRIARFSDNGSLSIYANIAGEFSLTFQALPERWLKSGEKEIELSSGVTEIYNPTLYIAKPLLKIKGTGYVTVNQTRIRVIRNDDAVFIDCDIFDAYNGSSNLNSDIEVPDGFPLLVTGKNTIELGSGMSGTIVPRWYTI